MNNFKKISATLALSISLIGSVSAAKVKNDIKIEINCKNVISDVSPFIEKDRTLVPIRVISENLGYEVGWDNKSKKVTVKNNADSAYRLLKTFSEISNIERINKSRGETLFIYETAPDVDIREKVFNSFADSKLSMLGMREVNATLEDIFLKVTNRSYVQTLEDHEVEVESEEDDELDQWDQAQLAAKEQEVVESDNADPDLDSVDNSNENMKEEK